MRRSSSRLPDTLISSVDITSGLTIVHPFNDVQVIATPFSVEHDNLPDVLAVVAASAALMVSDIPWNGPIGCVRVGRTDGKFVVNPTLAEIQESD